jgi:hypothetical protein
MSDLLQKITELKEDGRITTKGKGSTLLANYFDCLDSGCQEWITVGIVTLKIKTDENILSDTIHIQP